MTDTPDETRAVIERLAAEIDRNTEAIHELRREVGCPDGASLYEHLTGRPLFPDGIEAEVDIPLDYPERLYEQQVKAAQHAARNKPERNNG